MAPARCSISVVCLVVVFAAPALPGGGVGGIAVCRAQEKKAGDRENAGEREQLDAKVDPLFDKWNRPDSPGCAVGIIHEGELIYARGFGSASLEYEVPNTKDTVFEMASASKSFTSACIALLMDQGKIDPDDEIRKFLPEMHAADPPIRVRHLLRCETGVFAQFHIMPLAGWDNLPVHVSYTKDDVLAVLCGQRRFPFEPGSDFRYGSGDFFLLGMIVERASGKTLPEFARESLFEPLGMKHTFYETDPSRIVPGRAVGYYRDREETWRQWRNTAYLCGGSGVNTTVEDLHRWDQNFENSRLPRGKYVDEFLEHGMLLGNRFVLDADAYVKKVHPEGKPPAGQYRGARRMQFTGGLFGSAVCMARFPEQRFTVICLANTDEIVPWKMAEQIADLYLGEQLEPLPDKTDDRKIVEVSPDALRDKVGIYYLRDEGRVWRVSMKDGKLYNRNDIGETYELEPLGGDRFRPEKYPTDTFVFERGSPEERCRLRLVWPGGSVTYEPAELADPESIPESIPYGDYEGEYESDELSVVYRFKHERDALWLRVNGRRWERLEPTIADEFIVADRIPHDMRVFHFRRDAENRVNGFRVSFWRIKGLEFARR